MKNKKLIVPERVKITSKGKNFDLSNSTKFAAQCVREMHKRSGAKIFTIVEDAVIAYTKAKDPEVLKIVRKYK